MIYTEKYARGVQEIVAFETSGQVICFISEAIMGMGGILELALGYLLVAYRIMKKAGGLCIADEL